MSDLFPRARTPDVPVRLDAKPPTFRCEHCWHRLGGSTAAREVHRCCFCDGQRVTTGRGLHGKYRPGGEA